MANIKCSVNSCYYWGDGNVCEAEEIYVSPNTKATKATNDMEIGALGKTADSQKSEHTMCVTFKPKHEGGKDNKKK